MSLLEFVLKHKAAAVVSNSGAGLDGSPVTGPATKLAMESETRPAMEEGVDVEATDVEATAADQSSADMLQWREEP